jgi:hypothetical protein
MKSLIQRMLVSTAIGLVTLGSAGQAMAANPHRAATLHHRATASAAPNRYQAPLDVAAIPPYPNYSSNTAPTPRSRAGYDIAARPSYPQRSVGYGYSPWGGGYPYSPWGGGYPVAGPGVNVAALIAAVLGGGFPLHYGGKVTASDSGSYDYSYSAPDTSAADAAGWAAEQSANDASAAAAQDDAANAQALDASIAAAEEQNDEANAATQQTLINNGM